MDFFVEALRILRRSVCSGSRTNFCAEIWRKRIGCADGDARSGARVAFGRRFAFFSAIAVGPIAGGMRVEGSAWLREKIGMDVQSEIERGGDASYWRILRRREGN